VTTVQGHTFAGLYPPYGCLIVDPPWDPGVTQRLSGRGRHPADARRSYGVLTPRAVAHLPVGDLAAESSHLWLWVTNQVLSGGAHAGVLDAWGFRPITIVTWCKTGRIGLGQYLRGSTEHVILGVRGWGTVPEVPAPSTWFVSDRGAHSVKPACLHDLAEQISPGPRVELFQRQGRMGWDGWGWGHEGPRVRPMIDVHLPGDDAA
jgi:N6-adenosine-specific RNA methylase IME4